MPNSLVRSALENVRTGPSPPSAQPNPSHPMANVGIECSREGRYRCLRSCSTVRLNDFGHTPEGRNTSAFNP